MLKIEDVITVVFLCSDFIAYSFRANRIYMLLVMIREKKKKTFARMARNINLFYNALKLACCFLE